MLAEGLTQQALQPLRLQTVLANEHRNIAGPQNLSGRRAHWSAWGACQAPWLRVLRAGGVSRSDLPQLETWASVQQCTSMLQAGLSECPQQAGMTKTMEHAPCSSSRAGGDAARSSAVGLVTRLEDAPIGPPPQEGPHLHPLQRGVAALPQEGTHRAVGVARVCRVGGGAPHGAP